MEFIRRRLLIQSIYSMVRHLLFIIVLVLFNSCVLDHKLSMVQTTNDSVSLRLDGIYLYEDSLDIVDLFFLYPDGTILSRGSIPNDRLEQKLAQLEVSTDDKYKNMKFLWGRYIIEGEVIKFEKWAPSDKPYRAFIKEGLILNDSTFVINQSYNAKAKNKRNIKEIYKFRKTSSKPDSNNKWLGKS